MGEFFSWPRRRSVFLAMGKRLYFGRYVVLASPMGGGALGSCVGGFRVIFYVEASVAQDAYFSCGGLVSGGLYFAFGPNRARQRR